jgi:hypothetical protein
VLLKGSSEGDTLGFLGYCPQENVLWPNLTVREHLEVFAAVKGLRKGDAKVTIARYTGSPTCSVLYPGGEEEAGDDNIHRKLRVEALNDGPGHTGQICN